jgi:hypothetical protein
VFILKEKQNGGIQRNDEITPSRGSMLYDNLDTKYTHKHETFTATMHLSKQPTHNSVGHKQTPAAKETVKQGPYRLTLPASSDLGIYTD